MAKRTGKAAPRGARPGKRPGQRNQIRIIGGRHRGRRLHFPDQEGLRPTADRVRETLFNWLQPYLPGAACLDLFAGSGAIGLEAASRGAGRVVMLDRAGAVVQQLRENKRLLSLEQVEIRQADALSWLDGPAEPFGLVFLDPPFAADLLGSCCDKLASNGWLAPGARIYLERDLHKPAPTLPPAWALLRERQAGEVHYSLYGC